jgi:hypothetical protein
LFCRFSRQRTGRTSSMRPRAQRKCSGRA